MKDKMLLIQPLAAGSRYQETKSQAGLRQVLGVGRGGRQERKDKSVRSSQGMQRGRRGGPWFQKGLLGSGAPAVSQGWEVILCGWATAGGSSNGEQGDSRG